jgi:hypothetical protein
VAHTRDPGDSGRLDIDFRDGAFGVKRKDFKLVPDLLVDASRNSYITNQPPDTPSPPDASARWTAVVADQKAAGNGAQPSQKPTTTNETQPS